jgi:hypothetical protein
MSNVRSRPRIPTVFALMDRGATMKTYVPKRGEVEQHWYVVDATGQSLGRLASDVARVLRGKHKPT